MDKQEELIFHQIYRKILLSMGREGEAKVRYDIAVAVGEETYMSVSRTRDTHLLAPCSC